jgi:hypothetical protein
MGTRWVKSMRYFLPIYPLLCLYAAWGLLALFRKVNANRAKGRWKKQVFAFSGLFVVLFGTLAWANAFTTSVYVQRHTRILATEWMFEQIPGAVNFVISTENGEVYAPLALPNDFMLSRENPYVQATTSTVDGKIVGLYFPRIEGITDENQSELQVLIRDGGEQLPAISILLAGASSQEHIRIDLTNTENAMNVVKGQTLALELSNQSDVPVLIQKIMLSNESWDEGLPVRFNAWDPFSQLYKGNTMQVRWMDDENKKQMVLETLQETDYLIVPSQRAIWASSRLPLMYPMTIKYYQALFSGELGYELVAEFQAPMQFGPLQISDIGGTWAWGQQPQLPLFNFNALAAEEAFSVYDHPPVWIFKKAADFDLEKVHQILDSVNLDQVVVQSPREATYFETH